MVAKRPSWCRKARSRASCSAPLAPLSANQRRRSICRATNETKGIARLPVPDSTSLVSFCDSRRKNDWSPTENASQSRSEERRVGKEGRSGGGGWEEQGRAGGV